MVSKRKNWARRRRGISNGCSNLRTFDGTGRFQSIAVRIIIVQIGDTAMNDEELLKRITLNTKVMVGKPVIRGTRLTVEYVLNMMAHGATMEEILGEYEGLTQEDIQACLLFATKSLEDTTFMPLTVEAA